MTSLRTFICMNINYKWDGGHPPPQTPPPQTPPPQTPPPHTTSSTTSKIRVERYLYYYWCLQNYDIRYESLQYGLSGNRIYWALSIDPGYKTDLIFFCAGCFHWMSNPSLFSQSPQRMCNSNDKERHVSTCSFIICIYKYYDYTVQK